MAVTFFGAVGNKLTSANTTISVPFATLGSIPAGALMVIAVGRRSSSGAATATGFTQADNLSGFSNSEVTILYKIADGTEGNVTAQWTGAVTASCIGIVYTGVDGATPFIDHSIAADNGSSSQSVTTPSVTNTDATATALAVFYAAAVTASVNDFTAPSGMTERFDQDSNIGNGHASLEAADLANVSTGAHSYTATFTLPATTTKGAWLGYLKPASLPHADPNAGAVAATAATYAPTLTNTSNASPGLASAPTAAAYAASVTRIVSASAGVAQVGVTTSAPTATLAASPVVGGAAATAAAIGTSNALTTSPDSGEATSTGSALDPVVNVGIPAGRADSAASANGAVADLAAFPQAGNSAATAAALDPSSTLDEGAPADVASSAAEAYGPSTDLDLASPADNAEAAAAAHGATVDTATRVDALAGLAEVAADGVSAYMLMTTAGRAAASVAVEGAGADLTLSAAADVAEVAAAAADAEATPGLSTDAGLAEASADAFTADADETIEVAAGLADAAVAVLEVEVEGTIAHTSAHAGCAIAGCLGFAITKEGTPASRRVDIPAEDRTVTCLSDIRVDPVDPEVRAVYAYVVSNGGS